MAAAGFPTRRRFSEPQNAEQTVTCTAQPLSSMRDPLPILEAPIGTAADGPLCGHHCRGWIARQGAILGNWLAAGTSHMGTGMCNELWKTRNLKLSVDYA